MKKNLLALLALGAIYSANAQTAYIKDQAKVVVKPNTLLYMGNGLEISSSTPETVVNEGNIAINLSSLKEYTYINIAPDVAYYFKNFNTDGTTPNNGENFVNKYNDKNSYGQLMFYSNRVSSTSSMNPTTFNKGAARVLGHVVMEQPYVNPESYNWLPIAFPFNSIEDAGLMNIIMNSYNIDRNQIIYNDSKSNSRYSSTIMKWKANEQFFSPVNLTENITASLGYETNTFILNLTSGVLKNLHGSNYNSSTSRIQYKGVPNGGGRNIVYFNTGTGWSTRAYSEADTWGTWKKKINEANEKYETYIAENFTIADDTSTTYGKYQINFGNPFTHNLDLANLFSGNHSSSAAKRNVRAVTKPGSSVTWKLNEGNTTRNNIHYMASVPANLTTGNNPALTNREWTGDKEALLLRPFEMATIKMANLDKTGSYQFYTAEITEYATNSPKTFAYTSGGTITSPTLARKSASEDTESTQNNTFANSSNLYQLGLAVEASNGQFGNRVYIAAVDKDITGKQDDFELEFGQFGSNSGFWLVQEAKDGSYDQGSYLYINGFNKEDYVAKPLRMVFYKNPNDTNNKFKITANLAEGSTLNDGLDRFSDGN